MLRLIFDLGGALYGLNLSRLVLIGRPLVKKEHLMPNQMSDSRDGGPTFFMRQFGLFHTYRTVLQPGHAVRREAPVAVMQLIW